jgi:hypothetical protein
MLLVDLIAANPKTKFMLFHGGYPWIGEKGGVIATWHKTCGVDSVWLPTISYTMGKRAYQAWLEVMGSNRIMWGAGRPSRRRDFWQNLPGAAWPKRSLGKWNVGSSAKIMPCGIGRQIMRENALEIFPSLQGKLWKHKGVKMTPPK